MRVEKRAANESGEERNQLEWRAEQPMRVERIAANES